MFIKWFVVLYVLFFFIAEHAQGAKSLPKYFHACPLTDPNFKQCAVNSATNALKGIVNGDRKLSIPSLKPLIAQQAEISLNQFYIGFPQLIIKGLDKLVPLNVDVTKDRLEIEFGFERIEFTGPYIMNGSILILPITGNGECNITAVNGTFRFFATLKPFTKNGVAYASLIKETLTYTISRVYYDFTNLFNGDEKLAKPTLEFLNENWEDVLNEIGTGIIKMLSNIIRIVSEKFYEHISLEEMLLA